jgi:alpha-1,6-mannosyltransferase
MTTPTPSPTVTGEPRTGLGQHISRLTAFAASPEGRPALLGCLGAALITLGGLGAGSTRLHDPVLESLQLSWLRFGHGLVVSSVLLWGGVAAMLVAWLWLGRRVVDRTATKYTMLATTGFWLTPLLLSVPVFSRDTYSYLAQGALLRDGFDPYIVGPIENPNSLLDDVSPIWTTTTAPYGPVFILVAKFVTLVVGDHVIEGTMLLRLCMLPGLVMVGLMMAAIACALQDRPVWGVGLIAIAVAVKATAGIALPFMVWMWMHRLNDKRGLGTVRAFGVATGASALIFVVVFAVVSWLAGVGLGWLTALAGSVKIINWLTVPTATANLINAIGGLLLPVNFYGVLEVTRIIGIAVIAVSLPLLWWRFRHTDREALTGIALAMLVVVLFVPAALPWYYTWPLAVLSALAQSRQAIAVIAGFSTWIMVIFKPDGSHGMYSWLHVALATACAVAAWYSLVKCPEKAEAEQAQSPQ